MKLKIEARIFRNPVCSGKTAYVMTQIQALCGDAAPELIAKVKELKEVAFAYDCCSEQCGEYNIAQEHRGGSVWFEITRDVVASAAEFLEVADETEALSICKERSVHNGYSAGVTKEQGGKRNRVDANGKVYTCGSARGFGFSEEILAETYL